jgi:hypothetical protein
VKFLRVLWILIFIIIAPSVLFSQEKELFKHQKAIEKLQKNYNKLRRGWNLGLVSSFTLTQTSYNKWASGGSNVLLWATGMEGSAIYDTLHWNWANETNLLFGNSKQNGKAARKTDDVIDIESVITYKRGAYLNPYFSLNFRTQMMPGYKYDKNSKTEISNFMDPGYLTNGLGVGYAPKKTFRTRVGLASRAVFTNKHRRFANGKKTQFSSGLQWVTHTERTFMKKFRIKSRLNLFSPFEDLRYSNITWDTSVQASVTKYIVVNLHTLLLLDKKASPYTQLKEVLGIGLSYRFI